jgi:hypothetical protein
VLERELVQREVAGGYYGSGSYLAASLVLDGLLLRAAPALIFAAIMYPMVRAWGVGGGGWDGCWGCESVGRCLAAPGAPQGLDG